jgi:hypothetical protein
VDLVGADFVASEPKSEFHFTSALLIFSTNR